MSTYPLKFSVVIPAYNEENALSRCLDSLLTLDPGLEIIVADGGGKDGTAAVAGKYGAKVCRSPQGRGIQCNTGAAAASGDVLLFLHVDTVLPRDAFTMLKEVFQDGRVQIGTFKLAFDVKYWLLDLCAKVGNLPFIRFGDQCITVRRSFFNELGGFKNWSLFEDMDLVRRAARHFRIVRFPGAVTTSARRFMLNGILKQEWSDFLYILRYFSGIQLERIGENYYRRRTARYHLALMLFVRYPRPGMVKTRLAASLGKDEATEFYRLCAGNLFKESRKLPSGISKYVFCTDRNDAGKVQAWVGRSFFVMVQCEGDLGCKLQDAFDMVFGHGAAKAIVVASDVPDISVDIFREAFHSLDRNDMVIGPGRDGGYYLIGMKTLHKELFAGITWSTDQVYRQTMKIAGELQLNVHVLPTLMDIDTADDLQEWTKSMDRKWEGPISELTGKRGSKN